MSSFDSQFPINFIETVEQTPLLFIFAAKSKARWLCSDPRRPPRGPVHQPSDARLPLAGRRARRGRPPARARARLLRQRVRALRRAHCDHRARAVRRSAARRRSWPHRARPLRVTRCAIYCRHPGSSCFFLSITKYYLGARCQSHFPRLAIARLYKAVSLLSR